MATVTTETQFKNAITARDPAIYVANNINLTSPTSIGYTTTITGADGVSLFWASPRANARDMLIVTATGDLTIESLILDAEGRDGTLVQVTGGRFTMNDGVILRNVTGRTSQNAVSLGDIATTDGGTFIMNGGLITGIDSADAVFGGGGTSVVMNNDATIDNNPSAGISAANIHGLRFSLTMTGHSRISNNESRQGASAGIIMDGDIIMGVNEGDAPIVTGNHSSQYPIGGWLLSENTTLTMRYGAEISDNYSASYGGGVVMNTGALFMYGNSVIKNNRSDGPGSGLMLLNGATATMEDNAQIAENASGDFGGGVILQSGASLQMTGDSSIHSNSATNGAGMHIYRATATLGANDSSPQIYGNAASGFGGGALISEAGILNLTGHAKFHDNTAIEGKGVYKLGALNLSESLQILDGLFFDATETDGFPSTPSQVSTIFRLQPDSSDPIEIELLLDEDFPIINTFTASGGTILAPSYTANVPVIVGMLTSEAIIQLEASNYVSTPNVTLVVADKGPDYAQLGETDRTAWRIPSTFGPKYRVILNPDLNQVLIDHQSFKITYENLFGISHSNPLSYTAGDLPITLSEPDKRAGYLFKGWLNAQGQLITQLPEGTEGDITLTAVWEAHSLSFDGNDPKARNIPSPIHVTQGQHVKIPSTIPTRPCYCFVCWNMPSSGSGKVYFPGDTIIIDSANTTLYAQWRSICC